MYGVDMAKPGAQEYYDSVFALIASWGVDFVKVDDISRPYHDHEREIEAIRRAIDRTGRPMVLSLSPGETRADRGRRTSSATPTCGGSATTSGTTGRRCSSSSPGSRTGTRTAGPAHWPDADMLPLGVLALGRARRASRPDEQRTLMTLWSIARSPLIKGGDMTKTDAPTLALLTNDEVHRRQPGEHDNRPLFDRDGLVAWTARPGSRDRYLALFNTRDRFPLDLPYARLREPAGDAGDAGPRRARWTWTCAGRPASCSSPTAARTAPAGTTRSGSSPAW